MCATSVTLSYFHVHTAINILRCFGYPREHNFRLVLILSPTGCTEGCVYFPQSCRNTHLPHFLDCLLNTTLIPCLLVCFLSILHERVCDYSGVQSSVTGILRMGDMNIHITWLTHVRTGPPKKNRFRVVRGTPKFRTLGPHTFEIRGQSRVDPQNSGRYQDPSVIDPVYLTCKYLLFN